MDPYKLTLTASLLFALFRTIETHVRECRWAVCTGALVVTAATDTLAVMCVGMQNRGGYWILTNEFDNATLKLLWIVHYFGSLISSGDSQCVFLPESAFFVFLFWTHKHSAPIYCVCNSFQVESLHFNFIIHHICVPCMFYVEYKYTLRPGRIWISEK